tara:strand:- start:324 stop:764 length:441 start_codon:yes stop_codon:yes gene_type:complete
MAEKDKCYLEWSTIEDLVDDLCNKIKIYQKENNFKFKDLFGLQRGGLIPAVIVSHQLGIPMTKGTISPDTLIIDDICDSGITLDDYFKRYQNEFSFPFELKTACLHYKPHTSIFEPTIYAEKWEKDDWIVYPWEKVDSQTIQDYLI